MGQLNNIDTFFIYSYRTYSEVSLSTNTCT